MRHGADGDQRMFVRQPQVGAALEVLRSFGGETLHHFLVPFAREAAPRAEVEELEGKVLPAATRGEVAKLLVFYS